MRLGTDWNRTQVLDTAQPLGGALLVHGLTDSPYSMRSDRRAPARSRLLHRCPCECRGTGTPAAADWSVQSWEDWSAAVAHGRAPRRGNASAPIGAAGARRRPERRRGRRSTLSHALDRFVACRRRMKLVLVSPMIGVSPAAAWPGPISLLGPIVGEGGCHGSTWCPIPPVSVQPAFPANAAPADPRLSTRTLS